MRPKPRLAARMLTAWLFTTATSLAFAIPTDHPTVPNGASLNALNARQCVLNGCECNVAWERPGQGQYCGGCRRARTGDYLIIPDGVRNNTHIYECYPGGGCCDYGYASGCDRKDENGRRLGDGCSPFYDRPWGAGRR